MCAPKAPFPLATLLLALASLWPACADTGQLGPRITVRDCIVTALLGNRMLQIERINPEIARANLSAAWGAYDPILTADARRGNDSDTGGFDPTDFSNDAVYEAESDVVRSALYGFLPTGASYLLGGDLVHSQGFRNGYNFDSYRVIGNASVRQPLLKNLWIDPLRWTIRINKQNLQISELGVTYVALDVINQVQRAYYELLFAHENLNVQERLRQTRQEFLSGIRRQVEGGILTVLEEKVAESQLAKNDLDLVGASNLVALAENALHTVMGTTNWSRAQVQPAESLVVVPQAFDQRASWERSFAQRPDLAQMKKTIERANIDVKFRRNQLFPSLDLIAGYGRRGNSVMEMFPPFPAEASATAAMEQWKDGTAPNDFVGLVLSMPLSLKAERDNYRRSKKLREQAQVLLKQKEEQVLREVADAIANARSSLDRTHAARRSTEFARAALQAEEQKLAGGKSTVIFVLQLQTDFAAAQAAEVRAKADYNKALSQLGFAEGSLLQSTRIALEMR